MKLMKIDLNSKRYFSRERSTEIRKELETRREAGQPV